MNIWGWMSVYKVFHHKEIWNLKKNYFDIDIAILSPFFVVRVGSLLTFQVIINFLNGNINKLSLL